MLTCIHKYKSVACDFSTTDWLLARILSVNQFLYSSDMERPWRDVCQRVMQSVSHIETAQTASVQRIGGVWKEMNKERRGGVIAERKIPLHAATKFSFSQISLLSMSKICWSVRRILFLKLSGCMIVEGECLGLWIIAQKYCLINTVT